MSNLRNVKQVTPADRSSAAQMGLADIGCAAESALLAFVLDLSPRFRDALMASPSVSACATPHSAARPGSLLTSHMDRGARAGASRFVRRGGVGSFIAAQGVRHE